MEWFVYMISGTNGHIYTGVTTNLLRRLNEHNGAAEGGARATRKFRPYVLVYAESASSRSEAQKREWALKHLTHTEKLLLAKRIKKSALQKLLS